jgi:hypothetical protein
MPKPNRERDWEQAPFQAQLDDEPGPDDDEIEDELEHQDRENEWYEQVRLKTLKGGN